MFLHLVMSLKEIITQLMKRGSKRVTGDGTSVNQAGVFLKDGGLSLSA